MTQGSNSQGRVPKSPTSLRAAAEAVLAARGDAQELKVLLHESRFSMVLADDQGRPVDLNARARLDWRRNSAMSSRAVESAWRRVRQAAGISGPHSLAALHDGWANGAYYGVADVLPGLHVLVYAPARVESESPLTSREREVLQLAAEGLSGPQIAESLVVSPATVKTHLAHIYDKLGVSDRAAAVAAALRQGLID